MGAFTFLPGSSVGMFPLLLAVLDGDYSGGYDNSIFRTVCIKRNIPSLQAGFGFRGCGFRNGFESSSLQV